MSTSRDAVLGTGLRRRWQPIDPEIAGVVARRARPAARRAAADRERELHLPGGAGRAGLHAVQQVRRGLPGRRYYGGCEVVDRAEEIGIDRAKALFGAEHANLQPHSGASANLAAYGAFLQPGDTVLAMSLPHGGHLTHGSKVSFSGKWFNAGALRRRPGDRAHRLRPGARPRPRAPAEDDHRRRRRPSRG